MTELAILVPVLRRPKNVKPLVNSIELTTVNYQILFIVSPDDLEEKQEIKRQGQTYVCMDQNYENNGDYARKLNFGFSMIEANWYFLGADDLRFYPGWFDAAMKTHQQSDACVIGTNDLGNPRVIKGQHSTHSLVLRDYVIECGTIDEPGKIMHEGYPHEFCDDEFIETAKWRGAFAFSKNSKVEHLHPNWRKSLSDPIYAAQNERMNRGRPIFEKRKRLWL